MKKMKDKIIVLGILLFIAASCKTISTEKANNLPSNGVPVWTKDAVLYEVNVRQYTPEGTFNAFAEHLPRLKKLGVDILWFMPIHPIGEKNRKGELGSYYSVLDYKAINPEFGTRQDFDNLVNQCHEMGFKVIIDWVANHTAWDHAWVDRHPEWYQKDSLGNMFSPYDWTDVVQLDYNNIGLRQAMKDAMIHWVEESNIDGYRCDYPGMVPVEFWEDVRRSLDSIKPVFMLAEDEAKKDLLDHAFDMNYGWEMHHIMNEIAAGTMNASDIDRYFKKVAETYPDSSMIMQFTSNHDENSWNGTMYERLGEATETFIALSAVIPDMLLIYNGQEAGMDKRLEFFTKDIIPWKEDEMFSLFQSLIQFKTDNPALWNGHFGGDFERISTSADSLVYAFTRTKDTNTIYGFFNFSPAVTSFQLEKTAPVVMQDINGQKINFDADETLEFQPWEYVIGVQE
ncbi:MAG: alpha-amylase [Bacteroidetes bacterium]|jgi:glycosidase|nr:alpha-amylase [Bacteroidota bacterium]